MTKAKEKAIRNKAIVDGRTLLREAMLDRKELKTRRYNRVTATKAVDENLFLEDLEEVLQKYSKRRTGWKPFKPRKASKKNAPIERELNLMLSDLHFGSNLDPREVSLQYGPRKRHADWRLWYPKSQTISANTGTKPL